MILGTPKAALTVSCAHIFIWHNILLFKTLLYQQGVHNNVQRGPLRCNASQKCVTRGSSTRKARQPTLRYRAFRGYAAILAAAYLSAAFFPATMLLKTPLWSKPSGSSTVVALPLAA